MNDLTIIEPETDVSLASTLTIEGKLETNGTLELELASSGEVCYINVTKEDAFKIIDHIIKVFELSGYE